MKFYKYLSLAVLFGLTLAGGACSQEEEHFPDVNGNMVIKVCWRNFKGCDRRKLYYCI